MGRSGYLIIFGMVLLVSTLYLMRSTENDLEDSHSKLTSAVGVDTNTKRHALTIPDDEVGEFDEMVMAPCHGLWVEGQGWDVPTDRTYQVKTLERHITESVKYTLAKPSRMLLFSGGETHLKAGPTSEGWSYWNWARVNLKNDLSIVESLTKSPLKFSTEDFARDSFENLLFCLCRFRELTGRLPRKVTVFGFSFKKDRFERLHRRAIGYPAERFQYKSPEELEFTVEQLEECRRGEYKNAYSLFENDLFGCHNRDLIAKRKSRDPFNRLHGIAGYPAVCPELKDAFTTCDTAANKFS